ASVGVFTVPVALISAPDGTTRRRYFQGRINDFDRVQDPWIIWGAKAETDEREGVETDHQRGRRGRFAGRTILDRDEPLARPCGVAMVGRRDPHVIPVDVV